HPRYLLSIPTRRSSDLPEDRADEAERGLDRSPDPARRRGDALESGLEDGVPHPRPGRCDGSERGLDDVAEGLAALVGEDDRSDRSEEHTSELQSREKLV